MWPSSLLTNWMGSDSHHQPKIKFKEFLRNEKWAIVSPTASPPAWIKIPVYYLRRGWLEGKRKIPDDWGRVTERQG